MVFFIGKVSRFTIENILQISNYLDTSIGNCACVGIFKGGCVKRQEGIRREPAQGKQAFGGKLNVYSSVCWVPR